MDLDQKQMMARDLDLRRRYLTSVPGEETVHTAASTSRWRSAVNPAPMYGEKRFSFRNITFSSCDIISAFCGEVGTSLIEGASLPEEIVFALQDRGLASTAKRVAELCALHEEEEDEPEVSFDSLKRLAHVLLNHREWGDPALALRDDGSVHAEWPACEGGKVVMAFMPNNRMAYSAISSPADSGREFLNIGGYHHQKEAIQNLRWFTDRIVVAR